MWFLSFLAFVGFVSSLVVHILTFRNVDPEQTLPLVWVLFFSVFVISYLTSLLTPSLERREQNCYKKAFTIPQVLTGVQFVLTCFIIYEIVNLFLWCVLLSYSVGGLVNLDARYAIQLQDYHFVTRKLTKEEQYHQKVYAVRAVSGCEMYFYLFSSLSFWFTKSELEGDK